MAASSSAQAKEQGNAAFKAGHFDNAERLYTSAIGACSALDAKHLLHGNRWATSHQSMLAPQCAAKTMAHHPDWASRFQSYAAHSGMSLQLF